MAVDVPAVAHVRNGFGRPVLASSLASGMAGGERGGDDLWQGCGRQGPCIERRVVRGLYIIIIYLYLL